MIIQSFFLSWLLLSCYTVRTHTVCCSILIVCYTLVGSRIGKHNVWSIFLFVSTFMQHIPLHSLSKIFPFIPLSSYQHLHMTSEFIGILWLRQWYDKEGYIILMYYTNVLKFANIHTKEQLISQLKSGCKRNFVSLN